MSTTTDLGLRKPASNEFFNIADLTDNLDILNELLKARIEKTKVVNNLTTTEEGFIADARALKTLSNSIDSLNESLSNLNNNLSNKSDKGHTHLKTEVGLGNVDNTADADKSVKYAATAGSATSATNATNATNANYATSSNYANGAGVSNTTNQLSVTSSAPSSPFTGQLWIW